MMIARMLVRGGLLYPTLGLSRRDPSKYAVGWSIPKPLCRQIGPLPHGLELLPNHGGARCTSSGGCKCVSCYNLHGTVSSVCYPLIAPIPGPGH
jgi:hypothetical protein